MQDIVTSGVRTTVPYIVGAVVAYLSQKGVHVPDAAIARATAALTLVVGTLYYHVVRMLEQKYPKLGYLLGIPKQPTY